MLVTPVLCEDFADMRSESSPTNTRTLYVATAYPFLNCNFILVCAMSFSNKWDT